MRVGSSGVAAGVCGQGLGEAVAELGEGGGQGEEVAFEDASGQVHAEAGAGGCDFEGCGGDAAESQRDGLEGQVAGVGEGCGEVAGDDGGGCRRGRGGRR